MSNDNDPIINASELTILPFLLAEHFALTIFCELLDLSREIISLLFEQSKPDLDHFRC